MGLGTLQQANGNEKLFDIKDITGSLATKANEVNAGMEQFLNNNLQGIANSLALKNLASGKVTFDELLDGFGIDVNVNGAIEGDEISKEVMQYAIDNKVNGQYVLSEALLGIADLKGALKALEFEITSKGYLALVEKLSTLEQKSALAKSFLLGYQENIRGNDDVAVVKAELKNSITNNLGIITVDNSGAGIANNQTVDDLVSKLGDVNYKLREVKVDGSGNISEVMFDRVSGPTPPVNPNQNPNQNNTTTNPRGNYNAGTPAADPNCDNCPQINPTRQGTRANPTPTPENVPGRGGEYTPHDIENQRVAYRPRNRWGMEQSSDVERKQKKVKDKSNQDERAILRWIISGRDEDLNIVAKDDAIGDQKMNKATPADRRFLAENFKTPLQQLCINENKELLRKSLDHPLDWKVVWNAVVRSYDSGGIKSELSGDKDDLTYWTEKATSGGFGLTNKGDIKLFAKNMQKIGMAYTQYMRDRHNGGYVADVIGMFDNEIRVTNGDWINSNPDKATLFDVYENNNDRGEISLGAGYKILDKGDDNKAINDFARLSASSGQLPDIKALFEDNRNAPYFRKMLGNAYDNESYNMYSNDKVLKTVYDNIQSVKLGNNTMTSGPVMAAEAKAYGATPVELFNIRAIAQLAHPKPFGQQNDPDATEDRIKGPTGAEEEGFIHLLTDYSLGHGVDNSDMGRNGGLQVLTHFRFATSQIQHGALDGQAIASQDYRADKIEAQRKVLNNILCWMEGVAAREGDSYLYTMISQYRTTNPTELGKMFLGDKSGGSSTDSFAFQHPAMVKRMQTKLRDTSVDMEAIMLYGAKGEAELDRQKQGAIAETARMSGLDRATLEKKLNKVIDEKWAEAQAMIASLPTEQERQYYSYVNRETLAQHITNVVSGTVSENGLGINVGGSVRLNNIMQLSTSSKLLDDIIDGLSLNFGLSVGLGGVVPSLGLSWNKRLPDGTGFGINTNFIVPGVGGFIGKDFRSDANVAKLTSTLELKGVKQTHIGGHASVSVAAASAGVGIGESRDKAEGANEMYTNIRSTLSTQIGSLVMNTKVAESFAAIQQQLLIQGNSRNSKQLLAQKQLVLDEATKQFKALYPDQSPDKYSSMADSFYNIVAQYLTSCTQGTDVAAFLKSKVPDMADFMASKRKEQALSGLHGVKLVGYSVGLHVAYLWAGVGIVSPLALSFANYDKGTTFKENNMQQAKLRAAEFEGRANRMMMPAQSIVTVNALLNDVHHDMVLPNVDGQYGADKIIENTDGRVLVPASLYMNTHLNLKISKELKGNIARVYLNENGSINPSSQGKEYIAFPSGTDFRFWASPQNNSVEYVLNIGSAMTKSATDLHVIRGRENLLDPRLATNYDALRDRVTDPNRERLSVPKLTTMITQLKTADNNAYTNFPLTIVDVDRSNKMVFSLPISDIAIDSPIHPDATGRFTVLPTQTLTIEQGLDGKYKVTVSADSTSGNFDLSFKKKVDSPTTVDIIRANPERTRLKATSGFPFAEVSAVDARARTIAYTLAPGKTVPGAAAGSLTLSLDKSYTITQTATNTYTISETPYTRHKLAYTSLNGPAGNCNISTSMVDCYDTNKELASMFGVNVASSGVDVVAKSGLEAILQSAEHKNRTEYKAFMEALVLHGAESSLTSADVQSAYTHLKSLFASITNTDPKLLELKNFMVRAIDNESDAHKKMINMSYLVHKMACVFALTPRYENQIEKTLALSRKSQFDRMLSTMPEGQRFPFAGEIYNSRVYGALSSSEKFSQRARVSKHNMIGYSAFYRGDAAGDKDAKGFSLAPLGDVTIYNNQTAQTLTDAAEKGLAFDWIIARIKQSEVEKSTLVNCYHSKINESLTRSGLAAIPESEVGTHIESLLKGGSVTLSNGANLSFATSAVLYAQGECCNQGLGISVDQICVTTAGSNAQTNQYEINATTGDLDETKSIAFGDGRGVNRWMLNTQGTTSVMQKQQTGKFDIAGAVGTNVYQKEDTREWIDPVTDPDPEEPLVNTNQALTDPTGAVNDQNQGPPPPPTFP